MEHLRDRPSPRSRPGDDQQLCERQDHPGRAAPGRARPVGLERFAAYVSARFADDPHLWATALFDEVVAMGYDRSYVSFARQLRLGNLRPHCEACTGVKGRETVEIDHPPGEEIQWDWFERRHAPWGATAYVLLGTLSHSGRTRGVLAEATDQAHLIEAMDAVLRRLGGTTRQWRTDRLATVIVPGTRDVQASFAPVAKHYSAIVAPCPPRRGNRKGAVECGVKYVCGRLMNVHDGHVTATFVRDGSEDVKVTAVGTPGGYLHADESRAGDLDGQQRCLFVTEPFDAQARVQVAHGGGQSVKVLPTRLGHTVNVVGGPSSAVRPGGNASHEQVLDVMSGKGVGDSLEIGPSGAAVKLPATRAWQPLRPRSRRPRQPTRRARRPCCGDGGHRP